MANWYSSPLLYVYIKATGSNAVGTVRVHHKNEPKELKKLKLQKGECRSLFFTRSDGPNMAGQEAREHVVDLP